MLIIGSGCCVVIGLREIPVDRRLLGNRPAHATAARKHNKKQHKSFHNSLEFTLTQPYPDLSAYSSDPAFPITFSLCFRSSSLCDRSQVLLFSPLAIAADNTVCIRQTTHFKAPIELHNAFKQSRQAKTKREQKKSLRYFALILKQSHNYERLPVATLSIYKAGNTKQLNCSN